MFAWNKDSISVVRADDGVEEGDEFGEEHGDHLKNWSWWRCVGHMMHIWN